MCQKPPCQFRPKVPAATMWSHPGTKGNTNFLSMSGCIISGVKDFLWQGRT